MKVVGFDHVQLAMPEGREPDARAFYVGLLGLVELAKPPELAARGGVCFECGMLQLHLGVEAEFRPARKAHPALLVTELDVLLSSLRTANCEVKEDTTVPGTRRAFTADPFGNRIELVAVADVR